MPDKTTEERDFGWVPDFLSDPPPPTEGALRGAAVLRALPDPKDAADTRMKPRPMMSGAELRAAMKLLGLNNKQLASALGMGKDPVSAWRRSDGPRGRPVPGYVAAYVKLLLREHERELLIEERITNKILAFINNEK